MIGSIIPNAIWQIENCFRKDLSESEEVNETFFSSNLKKLFQNRIESETSENNGFLRRHLTSRAIALISAPCLFISRICDFALGLLMLIGAPFVWDRDHTYQTIAELNLLNCVDDTLFAFKNFIVPS